MVSAEQEFQMARKSAGLLMFRRRGGDLEVLLVHPGGPFWAKKDDGAWGIPKGEIDEGEDPLAAASREFTEETGLIPAAPFRALGEIRQLGGKRVHAWAVEGDGDAAAMRSNTFRMEWPPHSGTQREFPEIDRAEWFPIDAARRKILKGQLPLLHNLEHLLKAE
jgi:predicted NUDIX family NTP pyrophosphohydrolase